MQARSELAQVIDPAPGVLEGLADKLPGPMRSRLPALLGKLEVHKSGDQMLLGAVVQVPGYALTRGVGRGDQARPRRHQLLLGTLAVGDVPHVGGEGRLSGQASAGDGHLGRELGLGIEARSRALVSEGTAAEGLYREAIDRLGHTQFRPELARLICSRASGCAALAGARTHASSSARPTRC